MVKFLSAMIVAVVALGLLSSGAYAKDKAPKKTPEEIFKALDTDGDGFLSKDEFMAQVKKPEQKERFEKRFAKLDTNGDGKLSLEEFCAKPTKKPKNPQ
jgi:Ca2+-binding EF-hand superfamily protein